MRYLSLLLLSVSCASCYQSSPYRSELMEYEGDDIELYRPRGVGLMEYEGDDIDRPPQYYIRNLRKAGEGKVVSASMDRLLELKPYYETLLALHRKGNRHARLMDVVPEKMDSGMSDYYTEKMRHVFGLP